MERRRTVPGSAKRLAIRIAGIAAASAFGIWLGAHAFTGHSQTARAIAWGDSDTGDLGRFAERAVPNGAPRFDFQPASPGTLDRYSGAFRALPKPGDTADREVELEDLLLKSGTLAFLVVKDDELLYEGYFNGGGREKPLTSFSVAKSFASALVGAALADGSIRSLEDPVADYLPELRNRDPRFGEIRIRHLLSMSSGIRYVERGLPWSDDASTYYSPELRSLALSARIDGPPGAVFLYNNFNPLLIGLVLERATGRNVSEYLSERIWSRIGAEAPASWSLDREGGFEKMESGVNARAVDFLKFGRLYLRGGDWEGNRILPREWIEESTRPKAPGGTGYGYFWWIDEGPGRDRHFAAAGKHGQYVFVAPELGLLIARFGLRDPFHGGWTDIFETIAGRIAEADRR